jgi:hypothetical protein
MPQASPSRRGRKASPSGPTRSPGWSGSGILHCVWSGQSRTPRAPSRSTTVSMSTLSPRPSLTRPGTTVMGSWSPAPDSTRRDRRSSVDALFAEARRNRTDHSSTALGPPADPSVATAAHRRPDRHRHRPSSLLRRARYAADQARRRARPALVRSTHRRDRPDRRHRSGPRPLPGLGRGRSQDHRLLLPARGPWSREVLRLRAQYVQQQSNSDRPQTLTTNGTAPAHRLQASICTTFGEVVRAGGLAPEGRSATPRDVSSWLAAKIHAESGQIAEVALRLGLASLDRAAKLAGYDWRPSGKED